MTPLAPVIGISSLAAGADQLFADVVLDQGGELRVILPFEHYADEFTDPEARREYEALLSRAREVVVLPMQSTKEASYLAAGQRVAADAELLIAVWDGDPARGLGGTADIVQHALAIGRPVLHLNPISFERRRLVHGLER